MKASYLKCLEKWVRFLAVAKNIQIMGQLKYGLHS